MQFSAKSHIQYQSIRLFNATLVVRTRPSVHKIEAAKSKLKCTSIIVFFTSCDTPKTLKCMNTHIHTRKRTQSHTDTHRDTHTHTHTHERAHSRANSYNDLRPSEPTWVNASLTEALNWHFRRPVCADTVTRPSSTNKRVHPNCLPVDHSRSLRKCHSIHTQRKQCWEVVSSLQRIQVIVKIWRPNLPESKLHVLALWRRWYAHIDLRASQFTARQLCWQFVAATTTACITISQALTRVNYAPTNSIERGSAAERSS